MWTDSHAKNVVEKYISSNISLAIFTGEHSKRGALKWITKNGSQKRE